MKAKTILGLAIVLSIQALAQDISQPQTQAECKFPDGKTITVTYFAATGMYRLATDGDLVTVKGTTLRAGDYALVRKLEFPGGWGLTLSRQALKNQGEESLTLPMSAAKSGSPTGGFPVSFDQAGGSCRMHWASAKSDTVVSLEFTQKNADLPAMP